MKQLQKHGYAAQEKYLKRGLLRTFFSISDPQTLNGGARAVESRMKWQRPDASGGADPADACNSWIFTTMLKNTHLFMPVRGERERDPSQISGWVDTSQLRRILFINSSIGGVVLPSPRQSR